MTNHEGPTPEIPDAAVDAALRGHRSGGDHPGLDQVADAMNVLRRPAGATEQAGHQLAMAAYQERFAGKRPAATGVRRIVLVSSASGARFLATATGSAVALGAVATVLFATSLGPATTPQTESVASGSATTKAGAARTEDSEGRGPDAKGPAAFGLCNAWSNHQAHGTAKEKVETSTAFRNLAEAAGGAGKIAQYCAGITHPGRGNGQGDDKGKGAKPAKTKPAKPEKTAGPDTPGKPSTAKPDKTAKPTKTAEPEQTRTATPSRTSSPSTTTAPSTTSSTSTTA